MKVQTFSRDTEGCVVMGATFFRHVWANYNISENLLHIYQGAPRAN